LPLILLYAGDYLSVRYGIPKNRDPLGSVDIQVYYAVGLKNSKVEYMRADPETQTCVHSLFPHLGYQPCWYVNRHRRKLIEVGRRSTNFDFSTAALARLSHQNEVHTFLKEHGVYLEPRP